MNKFTSLLTGLFVLTTNLSIAQTDTSFTDSRDGNTYKTVKIGTQTWMAENLNYKTSSNSWCYNENSGNCAKYGRLYTWEVAKQVCPTGCHLPTDAEWSTLTTYIGGEKVSGGKLKATTTWNSPNTGATDSSGFSALSGGSRNSREAFNYIGYYGAWWSASEYNTSDAWSRGLSYDNKDILRGYGSKGCGFSVRCIRDY